MISHTYFRGICEDGGAELLRVMCFLRDQHTLSGSLVTTIEIVDHKRGDQYLEWHCRERKQEHPTKGTWVQNMRWGGGPQYIQVGNGQITEGKEIKEKRGRAEDSSTVVECFNPSWKKESRWEGEEEGEEEEGR